jgi:uncharacterized protein (TIGR02588 family)
MDTPRKNRLEWVVFGASLLVIATFVGMLVHGAVMTGEAPARLQVFLGEPRRVQSLFVVPVVVENKGGRAAAEARVEVLLESANHVERAGFDLTYSPAGSIRRGEVAFGSDPGQGRLRARVLGFELP